MKKAFTLAEILITLTIIGVIAVLTISNLIQTYKKAVVEAKVKEAYALLYSAIMTASVYENGAPETWNWSLSRDNFLNRYILPYLNYTDICINGQNNCLNQKNSKFKNNFISLKGGTAGTSAIWGMGNSLTCIKLKNNMDICIHPGMFGSHNRNYNFWVDINGTLQGNNMVGKEVFIFDLKHAGTNCCDLDDKHIKRNVKAFFEPGIHDWNDDTPSKYTIDYVMGSKTQGGCNVNAPANNSRPEGAWCAYAIQKNNWKIPKNYPIKWF